MVYKEKEFKGFRMDIDFDLRVPANCINVLDKLTRAVSSVDFRSHGENFCFDLCSEKYCKGNCVEVKKPVADLSTIDMDNSVASIKMC